jgi:molybdate transport system substrate-binding protein
VSVETSAGYGDWTVGLRVWVERAGRAVLGPGRLELLEAIDRDHSISAAARNLGMSYRRAWLLVQGVNEAAGVPLVVAATGGVQGGGAVLTARGREVVAVFRELQARLHHSADALLPRLARGDADDAVHVAAAVSLEEVLGQLLADYAVGHPGVRVRTLTGASDAVADQLLAGAAADLFLTADSRQLDRLEAAGLVEPGTRTDLAENSLVAIGPAGGTSAVRRPADLANADRIAIADPSCPLGGYTRAYLERLGLYEPLRRRAALVENSRAVLAAVHGGQADVGLVYGSDARDNCRVLFRAHKLPVPIRYEAAVVRPGRRPEQARDLLAFLTSRRAAARFRRCGFRAQAR